MRKLGELSGKSNSLKYLWQDSNPTSGRQITIINENVEDTQMDWADYASRVSQRDNESGVVFIEQNTEGRSVKNMSRRLSTIE